MALPGSLPSPAQCLGGDQFLQDVLHKAYRHFRGAIEQPKSLIHWDDVNLMLATHRLTYPRLRLAVDGQILPLQEYTSTVESRRNNVWHQVQPAEMHARLSEGASLVIDAVDEIHQPVAQFAYGLERWLRTSIQANLYASWTSVEGFGTHWDGHDVIVVQIDGAKRWHLFGPTRIAPLDKDTDVPPPPPAKPVADLVLRAGDVLYLPRGWWHSVSASEGAPSLHLTFGLQPMTGAQLLSWLADDLRAEEIMRVDVPVHASATDVADYVESVRKEVLAALDESIVERYVAACDATGKVRLRPSLPYIRGVPAQGDIRVRLTTGRARLSRPAGARGIVITAADNEWEMAEEVEPLLRRLIDVSPAWVPLAELAATADLSLDQVAAVVDALVEGHAATLAGPTDA